MGASRLRQSLAHGGAMVLFVILLFLSYSGYDIRLPFSADVLPLIAAAAVGAGALWAVVGGRRVAAQPAGAGPVVSPGWSVSRVAPVAVVAAFALVMVGESLALDSPASRSDAEAGTLRIMTFNLHNGFATDGRLDLEALARAIEAEDPDVLALQEVSRGWVINGSVDMLSWLSRRLGMSAVYGPTAGPLWGNAVLFRTPIESSDLATLPTDDLLLRRGFIDARFAESGGPRPLRVLATHYHHPDDGGPVRVLQSEALLRAWDGSPRTVIMGDLNGRPGDEEIEMLREAGLVEVLQAAGASPGYTFPADAPVERIDYIWVTPDLVPVGARPFADARITSGTASDHLGIAVTLEGRR